nr:hypothetical protein [uncultured Cohaesibacter sp.]
MEDRKQQFEANTLASAWLTKWILVAKQGWYHHSRCFQKIGLAPVVRCGYHERQRCAEKYTLQSRVHFTRKAARRDQRGKPHLQNNGIKLAVIMAHAMIFGVARYRQHPLSDNKAFRMIIFEWSKPGIWIEELDRDDAWRISCQIDRLENAIEEANVVLNMFNQARDMLNQTRATDRDVDRSKEEFDLRCKISREVEAELFPDGMMPMGARERDSHSEYGKRKARIDAEVRHRMWDNGFLPRGLLNKPPFIFAKAFIHALDLFGKFLGDIAKDQATPIGINAIRDRYFEELPDLQEVRNSIQHAEDRSKGMARNKKIELKKIDKSKIPIEGTALVNSGLNGNKFGVTMANGHYGAVDISAETIDVMRRALLDVYAAFKWKGGEQLLPR